MKKKSNNLILIIVIIIAVIAGVILWQSFKNINEVSGGVNHSAGILAGNNGGE